jgi:hypothetical protein
MCSTILRCDKIPNALSVFKRSENSDIAVNEEERVLPIVFTLVR